MPDSASRFYADPINPNRRGSECVRRTPDALAATVQHVSIDHRRRHLFVTQQLLNRTDVIAILQQIGLALVPRVENSQSEPSLTVGLLPRWLQKRAKIAPTRHWNGWSVIDD